jgi:hypothetical protein
VGKRRACDVSLGDTRSDHEVKALTFICISFNSWLLLLLGTNAFVVFVVSSDYRTSNGTVTDELGRPWGESRVA